MQDHDSSVADPAQADSQLDRLMAKIDKHIADTQARAEQSDATIERLAIVMKDLPATDADNGSIKTIVANTTETMEQTRRLREIVATLPEIASSQVDAIGSLDEHLGTLEKHINAVREERARSDDIGAQLDDKQRQIAKALNAVREMLQRQGEEARTVAAGVKGLTDRISSQQEEMRHQLTRQIQAVGAKGGMATAFSIIAALAAIGAFVAVLMK